MLWLAALLLSLSWLFGYGVFASPDLRLWAWALTAALAIAWAACGRLNSASGGSFAPLRAAAMALRFTTAVLAVQFLFTFIYLRCVVHLGPLKLVANLMQPLIPLTGLDGAAQNGILYIQTYNRILPFSVTCEKLGLMILGCMLAAAVAFPPSGPTRHLVRRLALLAGAGAAYVVLRFWILVVFFREYDNLSLYWNPVALGIQFLPWVALMVLIHPISSPQSLRFRWQGGWRPATFSAAAVAGLACFGACWLGYLSRGETKPGRILLDDMHSDWAWTGIHMGREDLGSQPTYSYSALKRCLECFYDARANADQRITPEVLEDVDVLVLKTPTKPFLVSEGEAIEAFVRRGGGLFLIGDHDNLFGMTSHINPIAHLFGIRYLPDDTFDLTTGALTFYRPPRWFRHPIVQHIDELGFETTCTLRASPLAEHAIIGYALGREGVDYSHVNFFGNMQPDLDEAYGMFLQGVAMRHHRGRVFALADSTIFSNFSLFQSGRLELFLGAMEYLNCRNRPGMLLWGFAAAALGFLALVWRIRRLVRTSCSPALLAVAFTFGACLGSGILACVHQREYPPARPKRPYPGVTFESQFSQYRLAEMLDFTPFDAEQCYETFYVNVLRLGRFPRQVGDFREALRGSDPVVLINPVGRVGASEAEALDRFVRAGGRVLLMLGNSIPTGTANTLLQSLGMRIELGRQGGPPAAGDATRSPVFEIVGGEAIPVPNELLRDKAVCPVIAEKQAGAGRLVVVTGADLLSRRHVGPVFYNPDEGQRRLYRLEYFIFDKLLR